VEGSKRVPVAVGTAPAASTVEVVLEFVRAVRHLTHPVRRGEITEEQYGLLRQLAKAGPLRVSDVAARLRIGQSAATMACQRLERRGWVERRRSVTDERVVWVSLTDTGRQQVDRWERRRAETLGAWLGELEEDEQKALAALLGRLLASAHERGLPVAHSPQE
jgi:DNA-binding MarR family transcriptional regulator